MSVGNSNKSLRKALGSIKDNTTISLAKVKSGYKELDVAIVKATNHVERPPNEKHLQSIFASVSAAQPRADVVYCIQALVRRLSRTRNWAVALKTLMVIHRALREVDPTFQGELVNYGRSRSHILNMAHFKDDSSPNAWNYSAWIRSYALFLEERLECYRILKYDVEAERPRARDLDVVELLELLPTLQQLLHRVIACQPIGATSQNYMIHLALSQVASDSMKIYNAISEGTVSLIDKFFEMKRRDAIKALDIYRRNGQQADRLADFYDTCRYLEGCRGEKFIKIEQRPASFLLAMEEYVRSIDRGLSNPKEQVKQVTDERKNVEKVALTIEQRMSEEEEEDEEEEDEEEEEDLLASPPVAQPVKEEKAITQTFNLLDLDDPPAIEKKAFALKIVPLADQHSTATAPPKQENGATGWEVALVPTTPNTNVPTSIPKNLTGGLNKLMIDCLYDDSIRRSNQPTNYNSWDVTTMANPMMQHQQGHDSFFAFNNSVAPTPRSMQVSPMNQQQAFMLQQQQQLMMMMPQAQMMMMPMQKHPQMMMMPQLAFGNSYGPNVYASGMPTQTYNPYSGML